MVPSAFRRVDHWRADPEPAALSFGARSHPHDVVFPVRRSPEPAKFGAGEDLP